MSTSIFDLTLDLRSYPRFSILTSIFDMDVDYRKLQPVKMTLDTPAQNTAHTCSGVPVSSRRFLEWYAVPSVCANLLCAFFILCPSSTMIYCHIVFFSVALSYTQDNVKITSEQVIDRQNRHERKSRQEQAEQSKQTEQAELARHAENTEQADQEEQAENERQTNHVA